MNDPSDPSELWASGSLDDWKALVSSYDTRIGEHKVSDHERWFRDCLPNLLVTQQGCLSKEQFIRLVEWKLARGKFRPSLRGYAAKQDPKALATASKEAYRILHDEKRGEDAVLNALRVLTGLKGVGPATASAMLAAMDDSIPFMSDEALMVCLGKREYTVKAYQALFSKMRDKQAALLANAGQDDGICIKDMEAALFASSIALSDTRGGEEKKKKKKKKKTDHGSRQKRQRHGDDKS
ncbi:hypothetical protein M9434_003846 [Picochlorum sp. BPE23]|nr:hypothetical protein M9434_003846 [Picochlorum sp. BPE23]